jgi:L-asparaginase
MPRVVVLTTGGTIASRTAPDGSRRAVDSGAELLGTVPLGKPVDVDVREVMQVNSFAMTTADMGAVLAAVVEALGDPDVSGVVVTHGTDTMEETAFLVDLFHDDPRPVVFTGAQRSADSPGGDGPLNLRDATPTAADPGVRGSGVLITFDGQIQPARGTRKVETLASAAFAAPDTGPVGRVAEGTVSVLSRVLRPAPLDRGRLSDARADLRSVRADTVALYLGADATAIHAHVAAGATGIVLEATGLGNANPGVVAAVAALTGGGIAVVLSTRVHSGPVLGLYGNGGGHDLLAAGAVSAGFLRPSQARILLLALLGTRASPDEIRSAFTP